MEVHLPPDQETQLNELAVTTGRGTDDLVQEAVARLPAHNEWFKQQVQAGLDQIARANSVTKKKTKRKWTPALRGCFNVETDFLRIYRTTDRGL